MYRALSADARAAWERLVDSGLLERLDADGAIIGTRLLSDQEARGMAPADLLASGVSGILSHERVPFVSYPYEWPFEMLRDAARLQLRVLTAALDLGLTLKDATPYNVQWLGSRPVFIDIGSFEVLGEGEPWIGYRQFCMLFLYPLMLRAYRDIPFQPLLRGRVDGITPSECARLLGGLSRLRRGVFKHVHLHSRFERRHASAGGEVLRDLRRAGFNVELIRANVRALSRLVERLGWRAKSTAWGGYATVNEYSTRDAERKRAFVEGAARSRRWPLLWDLGCNDGGYTRIAAANADYTVAMDSDEPLVDGLYRRLREEGTESILPLRIDLADPSPGLGWRGLERKSLPNRGTPDLTLCLALLHHLSISANIPVVSVLDWLWSLGSSLVIEFVTREDPMVALMLSRKGDAPHPDYDRERFERSLEERFDVVSREAICEGRRILYFGHPRVRAAP